MTGAHVYNKYSAAITATSRAAHALTYKINIQQHGIATHKHNISII